jgi:hypothetical protein
LNAGNNTLKFEKGIIDKIEIISVEEASLSVNDSFITDKSSAFLEKTVISSNETLKLIIDKSLEYQKSEVSIYDISGTLLIKNNFNSKEINVEAINLGKGVKIVVAKIGSYLFVDKIVIR